jgi:hypothetical protein
MTYSLPASVHSLQCSDPMTLPGRCSADDSITSELLKLLHRSQRFAQFAAQLGCRIAQRVPVDAGGCRPASGSGGAGGILYSGTACDVCRPDGGVEIRIVLTSGQRALSDNCREQELSRPISECDDARIGGEKRICQHLSAPGHLGPAERSFRMQLQNLVRREEGRSSV